MIRFLLLCLLLGGFAGSAIYFSLPASRPTLPELPSPYALREALLKHLPESLRPEPEKVEPQQTATPSTDEVAKSDDTPKNSAVAVAELPLGGPTFTLDLFAEDLSTSIEKRVLQVPGVEVGKRETTARGTAVVHATFPGESEERVTVFVPKNDQTVVVSQLGGSPRVLEALADRVVGETCTE